MTAPEIWLNSALVLKHFGQRPWLGRRLRLHTMRSTAGVRWKQRRVKTKQGNWIPIGEPELVRHELTVDAMIALNPVIGKRNMWRVSITEGFYEEAMKWLLENCSATAPAKKPRRYIKAKRIKVTQWSKMPMRVDNG
jgi:hypothetical protein